MNVCREREGEGAVKGGDEDIGVVFVDLIVGRPFCCRFVHLRFAIWKWMNSIGGLFIFPFPDRLWYGLASCFVVFCEVWMNDFD